jgi:hypothetical protein
VRHLRPILKEFFPAQWGRLLKWLVTGLHWSGELNNTAPVPGKAFTPQWYSFHRVAALLLLAAWAVQCAPKAVAAETEPAKFLGSPGCASAMCHGGADEKHNEFWIWSKKDFHTRAPATLSMGWSRRMADTLKLSDARGSDRCTVCHNPFESVPPERKATNINRLEGVSCESCHNAATENWLLTHTRTDLAYHQKVAAGLRDLKNLYVRANTCVACHQNIDSDLRAAGHPELTFELDGQTTAMPRHWTETNRLRGAQAWLVGQAVALREATTQVTDQSESDITLRAEALAWLLNGATGQRPTKSISEGKKEYHEWADGVARKTAEANWTTTDVRSQLDKLAARHAEFAGAAAPYSEWAIRAERLVLGLERLLVALQLNKNSMLSPKLDQLFKDIQSRPSFSPNQFAEHLKSFGEALKTPSGN